MRMRGSLGEGRGANSIAFENKDCSRFPLLFEKERIDMLIIAIVAILKQANADLRRMLEDGTQLLDDE